MSVQDQVLEREWVMRPVPPDVLAAVEASPSARGLPALVRTLLAQRGVADDEAMERFLRPRLAHLSAPERLQYPNGYSASTT